jgi:uncharacterized protein YycO
MSSSMIGVRRLGALLVAIVLVAACAGTAQASSTTGGRPSVMTRKSISEPISGLR